LSESGDKLNLLLGEGLVQDEDASKIVTLKHRHLVFGGMPKSITGSAIPSVDEYRDADWPDAARLLGLPNLWVINRKVRPPRNRSAARLRANGDSEWHRNIERKAGCIYDAQGLTSDLPDCISMAATLEAGNAAGPKALSLMVSPLAGRGDCHPCGGVP